MHNRNAADVRFGCLGFGGDIVEAKEPVLLK